MDESPGIGAKLYCLWATLAIGLSIALGTGPAVIVEGFHMISMPVFLPLLIDRGMSIAEGLMATRWTCCTRCQPT